MADTTVDGGLVVLGLLNTVGITVWRVTEARKMAREAGMNENRAAAMSSPMTVSRRPTSCPGSGPERPGKPGVSMANEVAAPLTALDDLRAQGLITDDEHATRRAAILDSI